LIVWSNWYAIQPRGNDHWLWYSLVLLGIPLIVACLAVPIYLLGLLLPGKRREAGFGLIAALLWVLTTSAAIGLGDRVRMSGMRQLADRSMPVVRAIHRYSHENGRPPATLADLVPRYLSQVPTTGLGAYPDYHLLIGERAAEYENNPWVLTVDTPSGGINFDIMAYFPRQNYPDADDSGWWERIGEWAYLHE
jgi:hypothetical protein